MYDNGGRRCRFMQALAAILLVTVTVHKDAIVNGIEQQQQQRQLQQEAASGTEQRGEVGKITGVAVMERTAEEMLTRGTMLLKEGRSGEAVEALERAVQQFESKVGEEMGSADAAQTLLQLGMALGAVGAHQRAGDAFARALRVNERLFGKGSNQAADCIQGLASALLGQGQAAAAASSLTELLRSRSLRSDHGNSERVSANVLALINAFAEVKPRDGENELVSPLNAVEEINRLSWRYFVEHLPWEGQKTLQQALDLVLDRPTSDSPASVLAISAFLFNLGFLRLAVLGAYASAADLLKQAYSLRSPMLGATHPLSVQAVVSRGWALALEGDTPTAVEELTSCAEALMSADQAPAAELLLRQALESALTPLGVTTYAHACFTQHLNLLKGQGKEYQNAMVAFSSKYSALAKTALLPKKHEGVVRAKKLLSQALKAQIDERSPPSGTGGHSLLELSNADIDELKHEANWLAKSA